MGKKNNTKRKRSSEGGVSNTAANNGGPTNGSSSSATPPSKQTAKKIIDNPLLDRQAKFLSQSALTDEERHEIFSPTIPSERRAELWMDQADLGEELVNRYAWATPDPTAIRILKEFSPLVEVGCGSNAYWCRILRQAGVDIVGFDINIAQGGKISDDVLKSKTKKSKQNANGGGPFYLKQGGPEVLASKELQKSGRTLLLCYPDEDDEAGVAMKDEGAVNDEEEDLPTSMGWQCLHNYSGEHVIHVGETFLDSNYGMDQAPWGRSSAPEFQQRLASDFHCILKIELPNWLHTRDTLSVWKRSTISTIVFAAEDENDQDEEVEYRHVPRSERLPVNIAAPCLTHLLPSYSGSKKANLKTSEQDTKAPPDQPNSGNSKIGAALLTSSNSKKKKKKPKTGNKANEPNAANAWAAMDSDASSNNNNDNQTPW